MAATVLLVEDEYKLRELVRSYLEREGIVVLSTGSGAEALSLSENSRVDLVVLDLGLPDVPGTAVLGDLRARSDVPVIILTAMSEERDRIAGLELGADDYVTKPFSPKELVLRVQAVLRRGRAPEQAGGPLSYGDGELTLDEDRARGARAREANRADPDRVGGPVGPGRGAGARVLALRAHQPGPGLRVRGLRAHSRLAREEPAAQGGG